MFTIHHSLPLCLEKIQASAILLKEWLTIAWTYDLFLGSLLMVTLRLSVDTKRDDSEVEAASQRSNQPYVHSCTGIIGKEISRCARVQTSMHKARHRLREDGNRTRKSSKKRSGRRLSIASVRSCLESVQRWFLTYQHLPLRWEHRDASSRTSPASSQRLCPVPRCVALPWISYNSDGIQDRIQTRQRASDRPLPLQSCPGYILMDVWCLARSVSS